MLTGRSLEVTYAYTPVAHSTYRAKGRSMTHSSPANAPIAANHDRSRSPCNTVRNTSIMTVMYAPWSYRNRNDTADASASVAMPKRPWRCACRHAR